MYRYGQDNFIIEIKDNIIGRQESFYKVLKHLTSKEKESAEINLITNQEWLEYYISFGQVIKEIFVVRVIKGERNWRLTNNQFRSHRMWGISNRT